MSDSVWVLSQDLGSDELAICSIHKTSGSAQQWAKEYWKVDEAAWYAARDNIRADCGRRHYIIEEWSVHA